MRRTPLYDVMSAWPMVAAGDLHQTDLRMAMALAGSKKEYRWSYINRRHWLATASRVGLRRDVALEILSEIADQGPAAVEGVEERLPASFPDAVAQPIVTGVKAALGRLGAEAPGA